AAVGPGLRSRSWNSCANQKRTKGAVGRSISPQPSVTTNLSTCHDFALAWLEGRDSVEPSVRAGESFRTAASTRSLIRNRGSFTVNRQSVARAGAGATAVCRSALGGTPAVRQGGVATAKGERTRRGVEPRHRQSHRGLRQLASRWRAPKGLNAGRRQSDGRLNVAACAATFDRDRRSDHRTDQTPGSEGPSKGDSVCVPTRR